MRTYLILFILLLSIACQAKPIHLYVEVESFQEKGGWVVDQQFMEQVGSSYLMAHGMGRPVMDAKTTVQFPEKGVYYVYVRTYNWTSPWSSKKGAGQFTLSVGGLELPVILGATGHKWEWQKAGNINIDELSQQIILHDLTGFNGRCDAIYFSKEAMSPPDDTLELNGFLSESFNIRACDNKGNFDFVVVGGGIAGMCAAVSAARLGLKVVLINDRPVLGGNNSSEVRVHMGGRIELLPYPRLGNLMKEFCPEKEGNAKPANYYEDGKKEAFIAAEPNISLYSSCRVTSLQKEDNRIISVTATHIETGKQQIFYSPLFVDCTGDGAVGYMAGADFKMGRESKSEFNEPSAMDAADNQVMGASVQWYSVNKEEPQYFPAFDYGIRFTYESSEKVTMGEWTWETGMNKNQITEFERIRDYGLMVIFSNWSYLKNEYEGKESYKNRALEWVAYIAGKRESRRLLGDHILTENDIINHVSYKDGTACTSWTIDLHYPDPDNSRYFPGEEFKSIAKHIGTYHYPIPYRCFYSRNIENLFMAGRNISVTHVALGTTRVMRTTGMIGEVVGMAAFICKKEQTTPRGVYQHHLKKLKRLLKKGTGKKLPNNQTYNLGGTLGYKTND